MELKNKLVKAIKSNDKLFVIVRCIKNLNDPRLVKLLRGYYEDSCDYASIIIEHNGVKFPDVIVYHIGYFTMADKDNLKRLPAGFCASLNWTLRHLSTSDKFSLIPVVEWGVNSMYHDIGMDLTTLNVFEYYFNPVSEIGFQEIKDCRNVIESRMREQDSFHDHIKGGYLGIDQHGFERLGYIYKKYIHLNDTTQQYIEKNLNNILTNGMILAVHVRGTDFNAGYKGHPIAVKVEEYILRVKDTYFKGNYDKIFLATEDIKVLACFQQEFGDKLLYYTDVFRTENHIGPHAMPDERPLHHYKLGLEVLRDVYTLANCESLICGLSQVSFAARYVNYALGRKYKEVIVLNNGIKQKDSAEARKLKRKKR